MNIIEHMMKLYNEGLEELMGAQKYAKHADKAGATEEGTMYKTMARQELEHAHMLIKGGDKLFSGVDSSDSLKMVWNSLREHLMDWHRDIERKIA